MAGILGTTHDIEIAGTLFRSATSPDLPKEISAEETVAPKLTTAANRSIQDLNSLTPRVFSSWHLGEGQDYYGIGENDTSPYRYRDSSVIDISSLGSITLLEQLTSLFSTTGCSVTADNPSISHIPKVRTYSSGSYKKLYMPYKKSSDSLWYIWVVDTAASPNTLTSYLGPSSGTVPIYDIVFLGSTGYVLTEGGCYSFTNTTPSSYTTVHATATLYRGVSFLGALYAADGSWKIQKLTTGGTLTSILEDTKRYFFDACLHQNQFMVLASTYSSDECMLYYSADGSTMSMFSELPKGFIARSIMSYLGTLYVCGSIKGHPCVYVFVGDSGPTLLFYNDDITGFVRDASAVVDDIYFTIQGLGGAYRYNLTDGGISKYYNMPDYASGYVVSMLSSNSKMYLLFINQAIFYEYGSYADTGYLETGMDYYDMPTQDKVYVKATVITEALPAATSVKIYYRNTPYAAYTLLGTHETDDATESTFLLPNIVAKGIEFKIELLSTGNSRPRVTSLGYYFAPKTDMKHRFKLALALNDYPRLLNGMNDERSGAALKTALESALTGSTFTYKDANWSTASYTVRLVKKVYREYLADVGAQKICYLELEEL